MLMPSTPTPTMALPLSRPTTPSAASTSDDDDAVLIHTPGPSEPDTFPDWTTVDMNEAQMKESETSSQTAQPEEEVPVQESEQTKETSPPESTASLETVRPIATQDEKAAIAPCDPPSSPIAQHYDPDNEKSPLVSTANDIDMHLHEAEVPGAFILEDSTDSIPDPPTSEPIPNPFLAATTAAFSLSALLAVFTARTIYNGATAASNTLYQSLSSDFQHGSQDLQGAMRELNIALHEVRGDFRTVRGDLRNVAGDVRRDMGEIVRETRVNVQRDVGAVLEDLGRVRGEIESTLQEVGSEAVGELRRTWGEVWGTLDEVRRGL